MRACVRERERERERDDCLSDMIWERAYILHTSSFKHNAKAIEETLSLYACIHVYFPIYFGLEGSTFTIKWIINEVCLILQIYTSSRAKVGKVARMGSVIIENVWRMPYLRRLLYVG